jgi:hypothetical protein
VNKNICNSIIFLDIFCAVPTGSFEFLDGVYYFINAEPRVKNLKFSAVVILENANFYDLFSFLSKRLPVPVSK